MAEVKDRVAAVIDGKISRLRGGGKAGAIDVAGDLDDVAILEVHDDIVATAAIEHEGVLVLTTPQLVVTGVSGKRVRSGTTEQPIAGSASSEDVIAVTAVEQVVALAAGQDVVAGSSPLPPVRASSPSPP